MGGGGGLLSVRSLKLLREREIEREREKAKERGRERERKREREEARERPDADAVTVAHVACERNADVGDALRIAQRIASEVNRCLIQTRQHCRLKVLRTQTETHLGRAKGQFAGLA